MFILLGTFLSALILSFFSIPSIIRVAEIKHLYDEPGERKSHDQKVPNLGGIAIFAAFGISLNFWADFSKVPEIQYVLCATLLMFFTGLKDDIVHLVAYKKFIIQIIAASILIIAGDVRLTSFYGLFGIREISFIFSYFLSLVAIVGITNSFNLIDGVNTLASGLGILITSIFGGWFFLYGYIEYAIIAFSLTGALLGFLYYNWTPAKVFMGDSGSLILGIVCSILAIKFVEINRVNSFVSSGPAVAIGIMMVPLFDTLRVMVIRIINRRSPFSPDKNHLHHLLLKRGMSHLRVSLVLILINSAFILFAFNSGIPGGGTLMAIMLGFAVTIFYAFEKVRIKKPKFPEEVLYKN
jgi:UDP-N-acetylmuramyl pentapeptide phosphotransferase/UDP-N-acetylglucosamine-1-phosphate transferase